MGTKEKVKKPIFKKWWFWVIVVLVIGAIGANLGDEENVDGDESEPASAQVEGDQDKETKDEEPEEVEESTSDTIPIGDQGVSEDLELTINEVGETSKISEGDFISYEPDSGKYALVNVTLKNIGSSSVSLHNGMFKLHTGEAEYNPTTLIGLNNNYISFESINPGLDITGNLVFNVPDDLSVEKGTIVFSGTGLFSDPIEFSLE